MITKKAPNASLRLGKISVPGQPMKKSPVKQVPLVSQPAFPSVEKLSKRLGEALLSPKKPSRRKPLTKT